MGVANLDDDRLKEFIKDPTRFLRDEKNFVEVFGLDNSETRTRVERLRRELWEAPEGIALKSKLEG